MTGAHLRRRSHMHLGSRKHHRTAVAKTVTATVAVTIFGALSMLGFSVSGPSAAAAPADTSIALTGISPVSVRPGKTLRITGRFSTNTQLDSVTVRLEIGTTDFISRSAVTEAAATPPSTTPVAGAVDQLDKVPAHATRKFRIAVPADKLPLATAQAEAGVYPMRVVVTAGPGATILEQATTFLPWIPQDNFPIASRLLFIWPLIDVPRRDATGAFTVPGLGAELGPKGRLQTLMAAGRTAPITWMIDPSLLSDVEALGGPRAREWLDALPTAVGDSEAAIVPFGDPDLAAVAASDRVDLLRAAIVRGEDTAETLLLGKDVRTDLGWPADGAADEVTIDRAHRAGADLLLLAEPTVPLVTSLDYTPSGRFGQSDPETEPDSAPELLLADSPASALVASPARSSNDVVLSRQRFLAETLLHTLELPTEPRLLVIAPPRRWDPDPEWAAALVQATRQASWLNPVSLDEAVKPGAPVVEREPPSIPEATAERQLPSELVLRAADAVPLARKFSAILSSPAELGRPIEEALLTSLSTAWRSDHEAAITSQAATIERLDTQRGRVRIVSQGGTLSDDRGLLPVTVRNQLDQPVVIRLDVESVDPLRLRADAPIDRIRIDAQGVEGVDIQLDAVTSGRFVLNAQILTPGGNAYSEPVSLNVDVRAYGRVALIVFGSAAVLIFLGAAVRLARRTSAARRSRT